MSDEGNIFADVDFDEGSDNPWGLDVGVHEVVVSNVEKDQSKNGNTGLWVTFSNDEGQTIRKWTTMPTPDQDDVERKRNTSYLRVLLNNLEIPKDRWNHLEPDDFIGIECVIVVKQQTNNPEYNQVSKITRVHNATGSSNGMAEFSKDLVKETVPQDGGFQF